MNRFQDKRVVVTGGNSGIGRATVDLMLAEGAHVAVIDKELTDLLEASSRLTQFKVDARDESAVQDAVATYASDAGRLDALVNAVGIEHVAHTTETTSSEWDRVLETNLKSYFLVAKAVIPYMPPDGGTIVNVASQLSLVGARRFAAYTASKAGIVGFSRSLALELADRGIRVNVVCPGAIDTPLLQRQFAGGDGPQGSLDQLVLMHPLHRLGRPEEIAGPIAFLCSDDASFMTGSVLVADGGYTAW